MAFNNIEEALAFHGAGSGGGALPAPARTTYAFADATVINMPAGAAAVGDVITMPGGVAALDPDDAGAMVLEWTLKDPWGADHIVMNPRKSAIAGNLYMVTDPANPVPTDADVIIAAYVQSQGATLRDSRAFGMAAVMEGGGSTNLMNGRYFRDDVGSWTRTVATQTLVDVTATDHSCMMSCGSAGPTNVTDSPPTGVRYSFGAMRRNIASDKITGGASSNLYKHSDGFHLNEGLSANAITLRLAVFQPVGTAGSLDFILNLSGLFVQPGNV